MGAPNGWESKVSIRQANDLAVPGWKSFPETEGDGVIPSPWVDVWDLAVSYHDLPTFIA